MTNASLTATGRKQILPRLQPIPTAFTAGIKVEQRSEDIDHRIDDHRAGRSNGLK